MKRINALFSKIRTPEEWKSRLYERASGELRPRPRIARRTVAFLAAAAVCVVSVTAMAASGVIDLGSLFRSSFDDDISASKIGNGEFQQPAAIASDDIITLSTSAFVGDTADSYVLMEARLADANAKADRISLDVVVVDENTEDISSYFRERYYGVPRTNESGDIVYDFKVKLPCHWVNSAIESGDMVSVRVTGVYIENDGASQGYDADMRLEFMPESSIVTVENTVQLDKLLERNGFEYTAASFISADYRARLRIEYFVPENEMKIVNDTTDVWYSGVCYGKNTLGIDLTNECEHPETASPVRLVVDGESIAYSDDFKAVQMYNVNDGSAEPFIVSDHFVVEFSFEPFDFDKAESVIIEIADTDGAVERITVK